MMSRQKGGRENHVWTCCPDVVTEFMEKEPRNVIVKFRMTENEKKALQLQAKEYQMNMSDYIRKVAARPPDVTKDEYETSIQKTIYEIHKIGVNVNQIAKKYNVVPSKELSVQLSEVYELLHNLFDFLQNHY